MFNNGHLYEEEQGLFEKTNHGTAIKQAENKFLESIKLRICGVFLNFIKNQLLGD